MHKWHRDARDQRGKGKGSAKVATTMAQPEQMANKNISLQSSTGAKNNAHVANVPLCSLSPFCSYKNGFKKTPKPALWKETLWKPQAERVIDAGCTWDSHFHSPAYQSIWIIPTTIDEQHQTQQGEMLFYYQPPVVRKAIRLELLCILPRNLQHQTVCTFSVFIQ